MVQKTDGAIKKDNPEILKHRHRTKKKINKNPIKTISKARCTDFASFYDVSIGF